MYTQHYGLSVRPFQLTPDPRFYFDSQTHRKAMAYLSYGLNQGEGFIVITGDIGTGKTTLVSHLVATVDPSRLNIVRIVSAQLDADDMLRVTAQHMGLATEGLAKGDILGRIERHLQDVARSGRRSLLVIDEAQNLTPTALEELRMLSNFQLGEQCLLQIFLLGQPEFRDRLRQAPELEQLRQRVIATHHLEPMGADEIEPYVIHRLSRAGWTGTPGFEQDVFPLLLAHCNGVPRKLNTLMSRVMLHGAIEDLTVITADDIVAVIADMNDDDTGGDVVTAPVAAAPAPAPVAAPVELVPVSPAPVDFEPLPSPEVVTPVAAPVAVPEPVVLQEPVAEVATPRPLARPAQEPVDMAAARPVQLAEPVPSPVTTDHNADAPEITAHRRDVERLSARIEELTGRLEEQDAALRRVLSLMIDWSENGRISGQADGRGHGTRSQAA